MGGTKTSWALCDRSYRLSAQHEAPTPTTAKELVSTLKKIIAEAAAATPLKGVGIGIAGLVDFEQGKIVVAPNLPLDGVHLKKELGQETELDLFIDNDANLAILGELYAGVGRGHRSFIGLTVGTGVGGGIVTNGRLWRGSDSTAAEFGHIVIDAGGHPCVCGSYGCFEQMASGTALERFGREFVSAQPDSELAAHFNGDPEQVNGHGITTAAAKGNREALSLLNQLGHWLGIGIGSLINALNPEIVILGGGVAASLDPVIETIRDQVRETAVAPQAKETPILLSSLKNTAGLIGAAGLVLDR